MEASPDIFANTIANSICFTQVPCLNVHKIKTYTYILNTSGKMSIEKKRRSMCISKKLHMMINSNMWSHPGLLWWKKSHCLNVCVDQPITERKSVTELNLSLHAHAGNRPLCWHRSAHICKECSMLGLELAVSETSPRSGVSIQ